MNLILAAIVFLHGELVVLHGELVKITSNVISGGTISIPGRIKSIRSCCRMRHLLRAIVTLVKTLPTAEGSVAEFPANLSLVVFVRVVRIPMPTTPVAVTTTMVILEATAMWFGATATFSMSNCMHHLGVWLLLFLLRLLRHCNTLIFARK
jgi:hypothetical protein